MARTLKYFAEFLNNPTPYTNNEFYKKLSAWADYIAAHRDEMNYGESEEWREIRERLVEEYWRREEIKEEFGVLEAEMEENNLIDDDPGRVEIMRRWLDFMKRYQQLYEFPDEKIDGFEEVIENFAESIEKTKISEANLERAKIEEQQALEKFDNAVGEHYERTGKRYVSTILPSVKKHRGN